MNLRRYLLNFRIQSALKITLGGIICVVISNLLHLEFSYLSILFLYLIMLLYHGQTFSVGLQSLIGGIVSAAVSLFILYFFFDSRLLYFLLMGIWIFFIMLFVGRYFLPAVLSAIVAAMSIFVAVFGSVAQATIISEHYVVQLFLGAIVAWIVDEYIWLHRSGDALYLTLCSVNKDFSARFAALAGGKPAIRGRDRITLEVFDNLILLIRRTEREDRGGGFHSEPYMKLTAYAKSVYIKLDVLEDFMSRKHECLEDDEVSGALTRIFTSFSGKFAELAGAVAGNRAVPQPGGQIEAELKSIQDIYVKMHSAENKDREYFEDLLALGAIPPLLDALHSLYVKSCGILNVIRDGTYDELASERVTRAPEVETEKKSASYFNRDGVRQSVKTVVIIMLLVLGEMFLNLPGSSQASFYGVLFGSMPNTGQAHLKGRLAIIGVLAGLVYGIAGLLIVSQIAHFTILLLLFALGMFVAAYVATGSQKIAYSGMQAGLMMPYVFLIGTAPQLNLDTAVTRACALLMASSIGLLVLHNLWPVSPYDQLKKKISSALRISGLILRSLLMSGEKERNRVESLVTPLAASLPGSASLLFDAQYVISDEKLRGEEFIEIIESLEVIFAEIETIKKTVYTKTGNELLIKYLEQMASEYERLCGFFERAAEEFTAGEDLEPGISELTEDIKARRQEFRDTGLWKEFSLGEVEEDVLIATSVDGILLSISRISSCIVRIRESEAGAGAALAESGAK